MKSMLLASAVLFSGTFALAENTVSPPEAKKIKAALKAWGCLGGKIESKMNELVYEAYEVVDARCKNAFYNIKLDQSFRVLEITRDDPE